MRGCRHQVLPAPLRLAATFALVACCAPGPPARPPSAAGPAADPSLQVLDRLASPGEGRGPPAAAPAHLAACLHQARRQTAASCATEADRPRTVPLQVLLDPRYQARPGWQQRLAGTLACVDLLYQEVGLQWEVQTVTPWDPGDQRNDLHGLLARVRAAPAAGPPQLRVGIAVWEARRIFATAGGEVGLSQGDSCVVPSWPRMENDCLILAHELGHLLGARHVPGRHWIMGWAARPFHLPAEDPVARVRATYRWHPRNREVLALHRRARFGRRGARLPAGCRRRVEALDRCWGLDAP